MILLLCEIMFKIPVFLIVFLEYQKNNTKKHIKYLILTTIIYLVFCVHSFFRKFAIKGIVLAVVLILLLLLKKHLLKNTGQKNT